MLKRSIFRHHMHESDLDLWGVRGGDLTDFDSGFGDGFWSMVTDFGPW